MTNKGLASRVEDAEVYDIDKNLRGEVLALFGNGDQPMWYLEVIDEIFNGYMDGALALFDADFSEMFWSVEKNVDGNYEAAVFNDPDHEVYCACSKQPSLALLSCMVQVKEEAK